MFTYIKRIYSNNLRDKWTFLKKNIFEISLIENKSLSRKSSEKSLYLTNEISIVKSWSATIACF